MGSQLTRGQFLRLVLGASACLTSDLRAALPESIVAGPADGQSTSPNLGSAEARISRVISAYDSQGIHRTGTDTDAASAQWLAEQARQAGATTTLEAFSLDRVDVRAAYVESDGRRIEGLPFFDGTFTDDRGLIGTLGAPDGRRPFALVTLNAAAIGTEGQSLDEIRRADRFKAIIAVTQGAHAGLSPSNARMFTSPYGVPVLQVGSEEAAWLEQRVQQQREVRFVAHATRIRGQASNVVASVAGRQPELAPIVVMTPRSGWWQCAGERGGGIACWLEIMRAAAATSRRPVTFVASSGHELGHLGLDAFIDRRPGLIKTAAAWIHLGANIGAAGGGARLQASDDQIEGIANAALIKAAASVQQRVPRGTVPGGEARNIHVGGGRYISLLGSSPFFHSPADRWPTAVDTAAVARFAAAFADIALQL